MHMGKRYVHMLTTHVCTNIYIDYFTLYAVCGM